MVAGTLIRTGFLSHKGCVIAGGRSGGPLAVEGPGLLELPANAVMIRTILDRTTKKQWHAGVARVKRYVGRTVKN
jgi:hypothetical protein